LPPIADEFAAQIVGREPLMALVAADHPLATREAVTLADLRETPFILFETGFALNRVIRDACRRNGFEPTVVARSTQIDFIAELAGAGLGVAFLPRMIATQRTQVPIHLLLLDEPDTDWTLAMAWRRGAYLSPAAAAWLRLLRERRGEG
jgi:DNA-binding transcriptional LysR family regulator